MNQTIQLLNSLIHLRNCFSLHPSQRHCILKMFLLRCAISKFFSLVFISRCFQMLRPKDLRISGVKLDFVSAQRRRFCLHYALGRTCVTHFKVSGSTKLTYIDALQSSDPRAIPKKFLSVYENSLSSMRHLKSV